MVHFCLSTCYHFGSLISERDHQILLGWIPLAGNILNATTAVAITEALGWFSVRYYKGLQKGKEREINLEKIIEELEKLCHEMGRKFKDKAKVLQSEIEEYKILIEKYQVLINAYRLKGNSEGRINELEKDFNYLTSLSS